MGIAIAIDNASEAMSIGELILSEGQEKPRRRILLWASLIGVSHFASAMLAGSPFRASRR